MQLCLTSLTSSTNNRSSAGAIPKPPISVSPASRRNKSLAQAVGLNRSTDGRRGNLVAVFLSFFFMAIETPFIVVKAASTDARAARLARLQAAAAVVFVTSLHSS